jgi:hypothetical protein
MIQPHRNFIIAVLLTLPLAGGCQLAGYVASVLPETPTDARYPGLVGQRVAIMTWADRALRYDYETLGSNLQTKIAFSTMSKLKIAQEQGQVAELAGTTFIDPRQVYRWQQNHPELEGRALQEIAPKLAAQTGATRVIYLELQEFLTRDPRTDMLLRGAAVCNIKVAEVSGQAAKVAYEESNIAVQFPDSAPEGVPPTETVTQSYIYDNLVDRLTTEVSTRFFAYTTGKL